MKRENLNLAYIQHALTELNMNEQTKDKLACRIICCHLLEPVIKKHTLFSCHGLIPILAKGQLMQ